MSNPPTDLEMALWTFCGPALDVLRGDRLEEIRLAKVLADAYVLQRAEVEREATHHCSTCAVMFRLKHMAILYCGVSNRMCELNGNGCRAWRPAEAKETHNG